MRSIVTVLVLLLLVSACGTGATAAPTSAPAGGPPAATGAGGGGVTVFAAASLKGVLAKAKAAYEIASPGTTLTISTDSSSALETQIEQGAPADVFLSADTANLQKLVDKGLAAGEPKIFAGNLLTVIVPGSNPAGITSPIDLANAGIKVIAAGDSVPITKYATQLVAELANEPGYPPDFADRYDANIVSKEDNVAAVVAKIELSEGDAAIVYVTDAKASIKVTTIDVPAAADVLATYAGVVVKASRNPDGAAAFLDWFAGPAGKSILAAFGFQPPS
ncbi:MAG: molybdate transport system substrate-binding protein [Chloroflexota bacterium]|nr:molybdate transport system substrate-binding protein [Chloroflexota bacterium]